MTTFLAYQISQQNGQSSAQLIQMRHDELSAGEVLIRSRYSSLNYKDALAMTGAGKVIRRFPCVAGIDVAGEVESSVDSRFQAGDEVLVTGYDMGVAHDGGYAEFVRVPADWVVPLPRGLSLLDAMALGTAGFTAALSIHRLEQNDITPHSGKVLVTGATGGVGSLAVCMLAQQGYEVVAMTSKEADHNYLKSLGASAVLRRSEIDFSNTRPLESAQWAAALDAVGGTTLAWLARTMQQNGVIASFGNAAGNELHTSVFPFILRGVSLIGIDSAATTMPLRQHLWQRLASDLRPKHLASLAHIHPMPDLPALCQTMLQGASHGRAVIKI